MVKGQKLKNSSKVCYNFPLKSWTEFFNEIWSNIFLMDILLVVELKYAGVLVYGS